MRSHWTAGAMQIYPTQT